MLFRFASELWGGMAYGNVRSQSSRQADTRTRHANNHRVADRNQFQRSAFANSQTLHASLALAVRIDSHADEISDLSRRKSINYRGDWCWRVEQGMTHGERYLSGVDPVIVSRVEQR